MLDYFPSALHLNPQFWQNKCWAFFLKEWWDHTVFSIFRLLAAFGLDTSSLCCMMLAVKHMRVLFYTEDGMGLPVWDGEEVKSTHSVHLFLFREWDKKNFNGCEVIQGVQSVFFHIFITHIKICWVSFRNYMFAVSLV